MKKRKLKKWVKVALYIIGIILIVITCISIVKHNIEINKKIDKCVNNGYDLDYCMYLENEY